MVRMLFQLLTVFIFVSFSIIMGIAFFLSKKTGYSEIERRKLTEFPKLTFSSLTSGEFTDNITKYVSDNFAFREFFVNLGFKLEDKRGVRLGGVKLYSSETGNNAALSENSDYSDKKTLDPLYRVKTLGSISPAARPGEELPDYLSVDTITNSDIYKNLDSEDIMGEQRGALFMVNDTALEIFYGNGEVASDYAEIINAYNTAVGEDVTVYDLVVPTHFEFGLPKKYKNKVGRAEKPFIDDIYASLDSSVVTVDAYSNIEEYYKKGEYLYFNSDHHWTALGAYRAYTKFAKAAGFNSTPIKNFEKKTIDKFLGTFYSSTYDKNLEANPDKVVYYVPQCDYSVTNYNSSGNSTGAGALLYEAVSGDSSGYLVFMGGDIPLSVIETDNDTGRSILVFKESYGNAFIPFLVTNYDTVYVADIRTFPFNAVSFVREKGIKEVLFLNNIMTSCTPPRIQNYLNLMKK